MSGGGWKEPFYDKAERDSNMLANLGNKIGWQGLEDEGRRNEKNPGRAIGKAATYAALYGIGSYLAGGGEAAAAASPVVDESAGLAMNAATNAAEQQAAQLAAQQALQQGGMAAGDESAGLLGANYAAPVKEMSFNTVPVKDASTQAGLLDKAKFAFTGGKASAGGTASSKAASSMATQYGLGLLKPQEPQGQQMPAARPFQASNNEQLHYAYGTPSGNSLGQTQPLTEEQKRRLRAQGYQI